MKMHDSDYLNTMYHLVADLYSVKQTWFNIEYVIIVQERSWQ